MYPPGYIKKDVSAPGSKAPWTFNTASDFDLNGLNTSCSWWLLLVWSQTNIFCVCYSSSKTGMFCHVFEFWWFPDFISCNKTRSQSCVLDVKVSQHVCRYEVRMLVWKKSLKNTIFKTFPFAEITDSWIVFIRDGNPARGKVPACGDGRRGGHGYFLQVCKCIVFKSIKLVMSLSLSLSSWWCRKNWRRVFFTLIMHSPSNFWLGSFEYIVLVGIATSL